MELTSGVKVVAEILKKGRPRGPEILFSLLEILLGLVLDLFAEGMHHSDRKQSRTWTTVVQGR